ncbi:MAG: 2-hydroxyacid dehydrogenase [Burkholderiales bacterium]
MNDKRMSDKPEALVIFPFIERWHTELAEEFPIHFPPKPEFDAFVAAHGKQISVLLTNGSSGATPALMDRLPGLRIIGCFSAGYENIDLVAAEQRGIPVTIGVGVNAASVADLAIGLMIGVVRHMIPRDRAMRQGRWAGLNGLLRTVTGRRLGLLGFGHVGKAIAKRAAAFDMEIAYHKPNRADDVPYPYFSQPDALADWCDVLIVCCPGGEATRNLVNGKVLTALGPKGFIVNIARGTIIDTDALIEALRTHTIAGAGLDVFADEPIVPEALYGLDNVFLSPHVAGFTDEAFRGGFELLRDNLRAHFAGRPLLTPIRARKG